MLYHSPEFFNTKRYNDEQLDFWGANLVLYMMVEGNKAFRNPMEIIKKKQVYCGDLPLQLRSYLDEALHKDRFERLNKRSVWNHFRLKNP